jgi:hypothetical protein
MFIVAAMAALALTSPSPHPFEKHRRRSTRTRVRAIGGRMTWNQLELAVRHELLHDFLVETRSERPAFVDERIVDAGGGLHIGPTTVDIDFLGAPIVRANVANDGEDAVDALIVVTLEGSNGVLARASTWVERIAPHADRAIELFCPTALQPVWVHWSVTRL